MPGRPKTKAKRVLDLLEQAGELISQFRSIKPKRKDAADPSDPLGLSWNDCETALQRAQHLLAKLALLTCEKAGLDPPENLMQLANELDELTTEESGQPGRREAGDFEQPAHWPSPTDNDPRHFRESVRWVSYNLCEADLTPDEAPSGQAWGMYEVYSKDDKSRQAFYAAFGKYLEPVKGETDAPARFRDDGRSIRPLIEELRKQYPHICDILPPEQLDGAPPQLPGTGIPSGAQGLPAELELPVNGPWLILAGKGHESSSAIASSRTRGGENRASRRGGPISAAPSAGHGLLAFRILRLPGTSSPDSRR